MRSWSGGRTSFGNQEHAFNGRRHTPPPCYPHPTPEDRQGGTEPGSLDPAEMHSGGN